jgi:ABC-type polysaccharide/polyol phosphate export permease
VTIAQRLVDLYRYRELVRQLVLRDLKARYKNSVLGFLWSLLNPLAMMVVFTIVFTVLLPNYSMPDYPVFFLSALLPWNFLTGGLVTGTSSVLSNAPLVRKVYFPREVLPISSVLANLVNFLLALVPLLLMVIIMGRPLTIWLPVFLPMVILAQTAFILGLSLLLSAVNVFYRDTQMILEVLTLAWFFVTPIFWPLDVIRDRWVTVFGARLNAFVWLNRLNPMASLAAAYRDVLYFGRPIGLDFFARTVVTCLVILVVGYYVFHRLSPRFGEEL